jgi:hypothetical protein
MAAAVKPNLAADRDFPGRWAIAPAHFSLRCAVPTRRRTGCDGPARRRAPEARHIRPPAGWCPTFATTVVLILIAGGTSTNIPGARLASNGTSVAEKCAVADQPVESGRLRSNSIRVRAPARSSRSVASNRMCLCSGVSFSATASKATMKLARSLLTRSFSVVLIVGSSARSRPFFAAATGSSLGFVSAPLEAAELATARRTIALRPTMYRIAGGVHP